MSTITGIYRHPLVCVDSHTKTFFELDSEGNILSSKQLSGLSFDVWALPDDTFLCAVYSSDYSGFVVLDRDGNEIRRFALPEGAMEVFGCLPLENGHIVLGDLRGRRLVEVNAQNEIVSETPLYYDAENIHEIMRMPRMTRDGKHYLIVQPGMKKIMKYTKSGQIIWQADTRKDTFTAIEKPDGNIIYSCIEGIFELNPAGEEVWGVTPSEVPDVGFCWALCLQLLDNGNIVVCNWLGHGHTGEGTPLFEITPSKEVVWKCSVEDKILNICSFHLLDTDRTKDCYTPLK